MEKMYVIVNTDLKMSIGKACSQVAHAMVEFFRHHPKYSESMDNPNKIVVLGATTQQLLGVTIYMDDCHWEYSGYVDEGGREIPAFYPTALALAPIRDDDEEKTNLLSELDLYTGKKGWFK